eukprot:1679807-Rhodomonas_salina.4
MPANFGAVPWQPPAGMQADPALHSPVLLPPTVDPGPPVFAAHELQGLQDSVQSQSQSQSLGLGGSVVGLPGLQLDSTHLQDAAAPSIPGLQVCSDASTSVSCAIPQL